MTGLSGFDQIILPYIMDKELSKERKIEKIEGFIKVLSPCLATTLYLLAEYCDRRIVKNLAGGLSRPSKTSNS